MLFGILLLALINLSPSLPETTPPGPQQESGGESAMLRGGEAERSLRAIEVYTMMEKEEFAALQAINREYEQFSGSTVLLVNLAPEEAYKTYREIYASGKEPDVVMLDGAWVADFAAAGRLLPADLYEAGVAAPSDLLPLTAAAVEWNGYRWAVPLDFDPYGAVWDPGSFQATSGELPQTEEAWREWEKELSNSREDQETPSSSKVLGLPGGDARAFASLIALWGGTSRGESGEKVDRALKLADELRTRTYLPHVSTQEGQENNVLRMKVESGELDLAVDRLSRLGSEGSSVRISPLPFAMQTASLRCLGITANTDRSREASLWIAYITGRDTQNDWYSSTGHLSALRAVFDESDNNNTDLLRWLPDPQFVSGTDGTAETADPKREAARESSWSRSLIRFYEGEIGPDKLAAYLLP
ncbi:ABC transporter substrate-binding protein [Saccharibacillus kuerlensis]|uniref:Extracellular solute-binding protein n=1 Tax=Saccharibacillus kuerlensis TaxID=459527 RepID=A0ABQ2KYD3_9BACL|nr:ABC transporter substrate-binding protein [Saccharibacillus kuerlensis]GGN96619.1 hypothetical protein GCM10010969_13790 [Saccharibacillus kuerlensis]